MKKILTVLLIIAVVFSFSACGAEEGEDHPYTQYDLTKYVTFGDYEDIEVVSPEVSVTEDMIDDRIQEILDSAVTYATVTDGIAEKGDKVIISYKGELEDGTTSDRLNAENFEMVLGEVKFIDGFQEAIYGAAVGEPVTAKLRFPDPYEISPELSGVGVTFEITVTAKYEAVPAVYDEEFMKNHSNGKAKNEKDFREYVSEILNQEEYNKQMDDIRTDLYNAIKERTTVSGYVEEEVQKEVQELQDMYTQYADSQGYTWEEFLSQFFSYTQEEFDAEALAYAQGLVKEKMIIYALSDHEKVKVTEERYNEEINEILEAYGCNSPDAFAYAYGMPIEQYAEKYGLKLNLLLDMTLEKIYNRLSK